MTQKYIRIHRQPPPPRSPEDAYLERLAQFERDGVITKEQRERHEKQWLHIVRQEELYQQAKPTLLERYEGQYIAFEDGVVLDSDPVFAALTQRLRAQHPGRTPLITSVQVEEPVLEWEQYNR